jgi:transcriptional regulator with XRE-family HTH domain
MTRQERLGRKLRLAREAARVSQAHIAELAKVDQTTVSKVELGKSRAHFDLVQAYASACNCSVQSFADVKREAA